MRRKILALALLFSAVAVPVSSQAQESVSDSSKIAQLAEDQHNQLRRLVWLEESHQRMAADLEKLQASSDELSAQVQETLARLAQSESAINATLESFQQKFDEQNQTIADVQEVLGSKMNQMLTYLGLGIVVALVLMFFVARQSAANAVEKHQANWNAFQEHLFKSK